MLSFSCILVFAGRTFPTHTYFMSPLGPGQLALFNLLKAYSLLDPEVGYCQGLSFVAGVLLLHVSFTSLVLTTITSYPWYKWLLYLIQQHHMVWQMPVTTPHMYHSETSVFFLASFFLRLFCQKPLLVVQFALCMCPSPFILFVISEVFCLPSFFRASVKCLLYSFAFCFQLQIHIFNIYPYPSVSIYLTI